MQPQILLPFFPKPVSTSLNLVVAHQFISQLTDEIKEAVFGNVGTTAVFRVGAEDAEFIEKQFDPVFTQSDLINLPIGSYYTRILIEGHPSPPFSMKVDWDMVNEDNAKKNQELAQRIREHSRNTYGVARAEVEKYINERSNFNPVVEVPASGKKIPF